MHKQNRVAIIYGTDPGMEEENLKQALCVKAALDKLFWDTKVLKIDLNLKPAVRLAADCGFVFNLVEAIDGCDNLQVFLPMLLDEYGIPYTGCNSLAIYKTTDKILTKEILTRNGIATPRYQKLSDLFKVGVTINKPFIVKRIAADASRDITDSSVIPHKSQLIKRLYATKNPEMWFVEEYIDGREFNVSIIQDSSGKMLVLPVAELVFKDYPKSKPKIMGYDAKWKPGSFECENTVRTFIADCTLKDVLRDTAALCWNIFNLSGYARVDFRVRGNEKYVLEINANPSIEPDAGLAAAAKEAGIAYEDLICTIASNARLKETR